MPPASPPRAPARATVLALLAWATAAAGQAARVLRVALLTTFNATTDDQCRYFGEGCGFEGLKQFVEPAVRNRGGIRLYGNAALALDFQVVVYNISSADNTSAIAAIAAVSRDVDADGRSIDCVVTDTPNEDIVSAVIDAGETYGIPNIHAYAGSPALYTRETPYAFSIQLPMQENHMATVRAAGLANYHSGAVIQSSNENFFRANGASTLVYMGDSTIQVVGPTRAWCGRNANRTGVGQTTCRVVAGRRCSCLTSSDINESTMQVKVQQLNSSYQVDENLVAGGSLEVFTVYPRLVDFYMDVLKDMCEQMSHPHSCEFGPEGRVAPEWRIPDILAVYVRGTWSFVKALKQSGLSPKMLLVIGDLHTTAFQPDGVTQALSERDGYWTLQGVSWHRDLVSNDPVFNTSTEAVRAYENATGQNMTDGIAASAAAGVLLVGALERCSATFLAKANSQRAWLRACLGSANVQTLYGSISFNEFNQNEGRMHLTLQVFPSDSGDPETHVVLPVYSASRALSQPFPTWESRAGCPAGKQNTGTVCELCPGGKHMATPSEPMQQSVCMDCEPDLYSERPKAGAEAGSIWCKRCPEAHVVSATQDGCEISQGYIALLAVAFVLQFVGFYFLFAAQVKGTVVVEDITMEEDRTVLTTALPHNISMRGRHSFPVYFKNTGHPVLDQKGACFRARKAGALRLEVLTERGETIKEHLDTSKGTLHIVFPMALLHIGRGVPYVAVSAAMVAAAHAIAFRFGFFGRTIGIGWAGAFVSSALVASIWRLRRLMRATSLKRRLREYRQKLKETNPRPRPCDRGPNRAITAGQFSDLHDFFHSLIRDRTMYYVNSNIVLPLTASHKLSFAEVVGPSPLTWYVSHYWGTPVRHFAESVCAHAMSLFSATEVGKVGTRGSTEDWRRVAYWICSFSNNQWHVADELSEDWRGSSFYLAMRSEHCRGTCMVLDPLALPLTRSWCLFELLQTLQLEKQTDNQFQGLFFLTPAGVLNDGIASTDTVINVAERIAALNLADAEATSTRDKNMIVDLIRDEPGGFPAMNQFVKGRVREVLELARTRVNCNFDRVFSCLEAGPEEVRVGLTVLGSSEVHAEEPSEMRAHL